MARELWVLGEWCVDGCWNLLGIFTKKSKAVHFCKEVTHFVAPVRLNQLLEYGTANWPGMEFPRRDDGSLRV